VDEQLYAYQKSVNEQVSRLAALLNGLDGKSEKLHKGLRYLKELQDKAWADLPPYLEAMLATIKATRRLGQISRPSDRQVGAWQSYEVTAYSKVAEAQQKAMSRMTVPSAQDWETVEQAKELIDAFEVEVQSFRQNAWGPFITQLEHAGLLLFTD
jgi:hypothetical protein